MLTIKNNILSYHKVLKYQNILTRGKILSFDINQVTSVINGYFSSLNFYLTALGQILILFFIEVAYKQVNDTSCNIH